MAGHGEARRLGQGPFHWQVDLELNADYLPPLTEEAGLSNFNILKTNRILEVARIIPAVNQVEIHP